MNAASCGAGFFSGSLFFFVRGFVAHRPQHFRRSARATQHLRTPTRNRLDPTVIRQGRNRPDKGSKPAVQGAVPAIRDDLPGARANRWSAIRHHVEIEDNRAVIRRTTVKNPRIPATKAAHHAAIKAQ